MQQPMQQSVNAMAFKTDVPTPPGAGRLRWLTMALLAAGMVSACSSPAPQKTAKPSKTVSAKSATSAKAAKARAVSGYGQQSLLDADSIDSLEALLSATDMAAVEDNKLAILRYGDVWQRIRAGFKMNLNVQNSRIDAQRSWFATRQPYIDRLSARASRYLYYTVTEAERRGIPTELALLPVIESSYDPAATSNAAAAGMWQFIPSTGTIYGLRQNAIYDGRRDVVESTRAAYEFLTSLYNQFGSWELALAAYNAGPGRVQQAINRNVAAGLPTDYWSLRLPTETMNYVPRFLAVAQIVNNPSRYGVYFPSIANRPHFREVQLPGVVDLTMAAAIAGLNYQELYELNPGFRTSHTDPNGPSRLLIPAALSAQVDARLRSMPTLAQTNPQLMASLAPLTGGVTILSGGGTANSTYSTQQAAALMSAGSIHRGTAVTGNQLPATNSGSSATTLSTTLRPSTGAPLPAMNAMATPPGGQTNAQLPLQTPGKNVLPTSSQALAAFANQAMLPSSPRIPVAITPAANVKPIGEPPLSATELAQLNGNAALTVDNTPLRSSINAQAPIGNTANPKPENSTVLANAAGQGGAALLTAEPEPSQAEKAKIVAELQALAPAGTQVVDPLDGKIKLTAIQTSQSVANAQGQELKIKYEQPVLVAQKTAAGNGSPKLTPVIVNASKKPQGERSVHVVQPGETLASVASRYGVNWRDIASWNQIDPNRALYVGTSLYLYNVEKDTAKKDNGKKQPPATASKPASYLVQAGDTLSAVASRFGFTNRQLADLNDLTPTSNLIAGSRLSLIDTAQSADAGRTASNGSEEAADSKTSATKSRASRTAFDKSTADPSDPDTLPLVNYKVKAGESLGSLANRYQLSTEQLARLNKIPADRYLRLGQTIKVPSEKAYMTSSIYDQVVKGKSAQSATDSMEAVTPSRLKPVTSKTDSSKADSSKADRSEHATSTYQVKPGDTLSKIASQFDSSNAELAQLNNIAPTSLVIVGQKLVVPDQAAAQQSSRPATYEVRAGDTLTSVAAKFNMPMEELAKLNYFKLNASLIKGETIRLRADKTSQKASSKNDSSKNDSSKNDSSKNDSELWSGATERKKTSTDKTLQEKNLPDSNDTERYSVKKGESLTAIAARYNLSPAQLASLNQLSANARVQAGQRLIVPRVLSSYIVKRGDSLIKLAARHGVSVNELAKINQIAPTTNVKVGDTLMVPN